LEQQALPTTQLNGFLVATTRLVPSSVKFKQTRWRRRRFSAGSAVSHFCFRFCESSNALTAWSARSSLRRSVDCSSIVSTATRSRSSVFFVSKAGSSTAYEHNVWNLRYINAPVVRYRDANSHTASTSTGDGTLEETLYVTYEPTSTSQVWCRKPNVRGAIRLHAVWRPDSADGYFGSRSSTSHDWQLGHRGLRIDTETGTYYNRARQLHAGLGAFASRDPLGTQFVDGPTLYQAVRATLSHSEIRRGWAR
jgi:RHS repeat-associated protein